MPTYVYRREDGTTFEQVQAFTDDALTSCPTTGQAVQRVLFPPRVTKWPKGTHNGDYMRRSRPWGQGRRAVS